MANANILRLAPNATYNSPARIGVRVGGNGNCCVRVWGNANHRYQHVGIPNTKLWRWGTKPARGPNENGFALQWNIDLTMALQAPLLKPY